MVILFCFWRIAKLITTPLESTISPTRFIPLLNHLSIKRVVSDNWLLYHKQDCIMSAFDITFCWWHSSCQKSNTWIQKVLSIFFVVKLTTLLSSLLGTLVLHSFQQREHTMVDFYLLLASLPNLFLMLSQNKKYLLFLSHLLRNLYIALFFLFYRVYCPTQIYRGYH